MSGNPPRLCIVAGEESGDIYGAELAVALRALAPEIVLEGMGGSRMEAAGVKIVVDSRNLGAMGIVEAHNKLGGIVRAYRRLSSHLAKTRYDAVVCIDFPEFNLRLARSAKRRGHRVIYYVTPQIWAWRRWRVRLLRKYADLCLVVLPFEADFYRARKVKAEFVGHPLLDLVKPAPDKAGFLREVDLDPSRPVIGLLPGSRRAEIRYMLSTLRKAAEKLSRARPNLHFLLPVAPTVRRGQVEHYLDGHGLDLALVEGRAHDVMSSSDLCLIVSGTATLEAAILGTPMVIIYQGSYPSGLVAKLLLRIPSFGLPNIVAGRTIVPELSQKEVSPEAIAREALSILDEPVVRQTMVAELDKVRSLLGDGGATERAARRILEFLVVS